MKLKKRVCLVALIAMSVSAITLASIPRGWEKVSDDNGISVARQEVAGSPLVAFRGEAVIDAPMAKVANVLMDTSRKLEWVSDIKEARDIRQINQFERVEYNHTGTPWPTTDRDFVFHATAKLDRANQSMTFELKSIVDPAVPETKNVRGELKQSYYKLTSIANGTKTMLEVEIQADPKGAIPKWLVNLTQKKWPRKTIEGIRAQCAKPDVLEHPGIKAYFASKG